MLEITERYGKSLHPDRVPPPGAPHWIESIDNPYLHGLFAPVTAEVAAHALEVEGELPRDLHGAYFRNGPNNRYAPLNRYHWFDGDGMVHGIWFENGEARYRNRYVHTAGFELESERNAPIWPGVLGPFDFSAPLHPIKDTANTDLIFLNGQLLALWYESGRLYALDPETLEPRGVQDFHGKLVERVSAHSKVDPATGDFLFFGYGDEPPYMTYGVVRPDGTVHHTEITLPGPRRPHDLGVTPHHSILHDFPVFHDEALFRQTGRRIPLFHPEVPTRYGVIPRFGKGTDVRWFDFEPCYMLHVVNCWEDGDWVVMIGCRTTDPSLKPDKRDGKIAAMLSGLELQANLYVWGMNLATGETREGPMDDLNAEFPMIHPGMLGRKNRWSYHARIPYEIPATFDGLVKYDLETAASERFDYGPGIFGSEAPFAPRPGATDEDDGWLLTFVTDVNRWSSECWVFHAQALRDGPIAKVKLPQRVPAGFHATWVPGA
ncbi:MAG: carotenoid oxygenase family protein [Alphaproteobacteria bacterium]|nr:carotenoid oxygenase family protein [Alphaproteobacteria bacterium]